MDNKQTPIQLARAKRKEMKEQGIKLERKDWTQKAKEKPTSMKLAIAAKCWDCCNHQMEEIRNCGMKNKCSLYEFRPYKLPGE